MRNIIFASMLCAAVLSGCTELQNINFRNCCARYGGIPAGGGCTDVPRENVGRMGACMQNGDGLS